MSLRQNTTPGKIRIIGGSWRGSRIEVPPVPGLRPTPDRVRETVFNWLQPVIDGAKCLDLYAGTGILGLEALSRGAARVVFVEQDRLLAAAIEQQLRRLNGAGAEIICTDVQEWLETAMCGFDVVFMDPPFRRDLVTRTCELLVNRGHLAPGALVYIEHEAGGTGPVTALAPRKQSRAGQVQYSLWAYQRDP